MGIKGIKEPREEKVRAILAKKSLVKEVENSTEKREISAWRKRGRTRKGEKVKEDRFCIIWKCGE